jgi:hypothetical protein
MIRHLMSLYAKYLLNTLLYGHEFRIYNSLALCTFYTVCEEELICRSFVITNCLRKNYSKGRET